MEIQGGREIKRRTKVSNIEHTKNNRTDFKPEYTQNESKSVLFFTVDMDAY